MKNRLATSNQQPATRRGSALIITMLVVAAISTAAFGLSRIFLADVRTAGALEDSLLAYYAAEAGVEEGLLRYRVDRLNEQGINEVDPANPLSRTVADGDFKMSTTFLTTAPVSTVSENNTDYPDGLVEQDETVEVATIPGDTGPVTINWQWGRDGAPSFTSGTRDCGVEITTVYGDGTFIKEVIPPSGLQGTSSDTGLRQAVRVKPLCEDLASVTFDANGPIGRTVQTVGSTGTVGRAKRRLEATLNRRSGEIVGLFDFVLGSEGCLEKPTVSC